MRHRLAAVLPAALLAVASLAQGPDPVTRAEAYYKHRLVEDGKRLAIDTMLATEEEGVRRRCQGLLARIAVEEGRIDDAVELWQDIVRRGKDSEEGRAAARFVEQWATLARAGKVATGRDPLAAAGFAAAEFWVGTSLREAPFDLTWIDREEAAEYWLRRVAAECPGTPAAAEAWAAIVRLWLSREPAPAPSTSAVLASARTDRRSKDPEFERRLERAERAVGELEKGFPRSPELPALYYRFAQVHWLRHDLERAQPWLLKCADGEVETFWTHLARLRLQHLRG